MNRPLIAGLGAALSLSLLAGQAWAAPSYTSTRIEGLIPMRLNEQGQILGAVADQASSDWLPAIWQASHVTTLQVPGLRPVYALDINESGQVLFAGGSIDTPPATYVWDQGKVQSVQAPSGGAYFIPGGAIRNDGSVPGALGTMGGDLSGPLTWRNGAFTPLPTNAAAALHQVIPNAANAAGDWAGRSVYSDSGNFLTTIQPAFFQAGKYTELPLRVVDYPIPLVYMNEAGEGIATVVPEDLYGHQAYFVKNGQYQNIGTLTTIFEDINGQGYNEFGGRSAEALAINNLGQVVGTSGFKPFVWSASTGLVDLGPLVEGYHALSAGFPEGGIFLNTAFAINDRGQILAGGNYEGDKMAYFLLTPVPEPSAVTLVSAGLVFLAIGAKRRRS